MKSQFWPCLELFQFPVWTRPANKEIYCRHWYHSKQVCFPRAWSTSADENFGKTFANFYQKLQLIQPIAIEQCHVVPGTLPFWSRDDMKEQYSGSDCPAVLRPPASIGKAVLTDSIRISAVGEEVSSTEQGLWHDHCPCVRQHTVVACKSESTLDMSHQSPGPPAVADDVVDLWQVYQSPNKLELKFDSPLRADVIAKFSAVFDEDISRYCGQKIYATASNTLAQLTPGGLSVLETPFLAYLCVSIWPISARVFTILLIGVLPQADLREMRAMCLSVPIFVRLWSSRGW